MLDSENSARIKWNKELFEFLTEVLQMLLDDRLLSKISNRKKERKSILIVRHGHNK